MYDSHSSGTLTAMKDAVLSKVGIEGFWVLFIASCLFDYFCGYILGNSGAVISDVHQDEESAMAKLLI
jgi:hypothetical protein